MMREVWFTHMNSESASVLALQLEHYGHMAVVEMPDPVPGPGEVALDIVATGICGSDVHGYIAQRSSRTRAGSWGNEAVGWGVGALDRMESTARVMSSAHRRPSTPCS